MKNLTRVLALVLLVAAMATMLVSCTKYPSLKKAFEKEGYTESSAIEGVFEDIRKALEKEELSVNLHLMTKGIVNSALIIEFKATEDMKKAYDENAMIRDFVKNVTEDEDAKAFAKALEDAGYAKGNCLVLSLSSEVRTIVKSVK